MQNQFASRVYLGEKKKNLFLRIVLLVACAVIVFCLLIKVIVADFSFSDISGILFSLLIIYNSRVSMKSIPQYAMADGIIDFENERMTITYANVDGGKNLGRFTERTIIRYEDIKSIQYGEALECYRIVTKCKRCRVFHDFGKENVMDNGVSDTEVFIYVFDSDEEKNIRNSLQKYSAHIVSVISDEDMDEEDE